MSSELPNVRRHFLPWNRPWIGQATTWLAREWVGGGPLDLSGTLALVPTQQAGRRLREALAGFAAERGSAVFAPRVLTPDALVKQDLGAGVASALETLLAWTHVFLSLDGEAFREVFPVDPPARNFPWALRLAQQFTRLQVTLAEVGLRLRDVQAGAGREFVEQKRWEEIAELDRLHEAQLTERHLREPQAARIEAANHPRLEQQFERIVVLAIPDLSPLTKIRLAKAAATRSIDVVIFAPENEGANFDGWGRPGSESWTQRVIELGEFEQRVHLCADPTNQAARLAQLVSRYEPASGALAVGIADPEIVPLLENELKRLDRSVFNPEGRLFRREGLYTLLACLAELVREPSFTAVETLARCPDFIARLKTEYGGGFSAARWLESLDNLRARHIPADLKAARMFASKWERPRELIQGLDAIEALRALLLSQSFADGGAQVLREIFSGREIDRTQEHDVRFEEVANAWTAIVCECQNANERFGSLTLSDAWELALRLFGAQRIADEKRAAALDLQGWLELLWEDAPHLAVAGLNDGSVPEGVPEDAFLPGSLRQRLGLTTNETRFARDAYLLQAIATSRAGSGRLDLLFGKTAAAGDPLRPSRLLLRCVDSELPARIPFLFRALEVGGAMSFWTRAWKLTPRFAPPPERVAVTALRRYLLCPFRFYLRNVLGTESVDPLKSELDAFDFGTLCHTALEQIGLDPALRQCTDGRILGAELLHHLDQAVLQRYGKMLSLPLLVQVESARQRLSKLAELQAGERAAGWEILFVERPFELEISGLVVRGKIDRIDRHAETGAVRVLDYKTSDTPVTPAAAHLRFLRSDEKVPDWARWDDETRLRAWSDLQLPLYLRALAAEFPGPVKSGYFNLPKAAGETSLALWDDYTIELHDSAMRCVAGACAAIRRGEFWPPNETIRPDRDEYAALFHHGVETSVEWSGR